MQERMPHNALYKPNPTPDENGVLAHEMRLSVDLYVHFVHFEDLCLDMLWDHVGMRRTLEQELSRTALHLTNRAEAIRSPAHSHQS